MSPSRSLVFAVLLASACRTHAPAAVRVDEPSARSVLEVPPAEMRSAIVGEFRLKPDRRFLVAVSEMARFVTGRSPDEVSAVYANGAWRVLSGREEVGSLPPLPGFHDADILLVRWARRLTAGRGWRLDPGGGAASIRQALGEFAAPVVGEALREIDREWRSTPRAGTLALAAHGLVALTLQLQDRLELADQLPGKALAAVALTHALQADADPRDAVLLAAALGYTAEAAELARALPEEDPVRLYALGHTVALGGLARRADADARTRFLYSSRLAEERDVDAWRVWSSEPWNATRPTTGVVGTGLAANRFELDRVVPRSLVGLVQGELAAASGPAVWVERLRAAVWRVFGAADDSGPLDRFEAEVARLARRFRGPWLDAPTYAAYFRGHLYSALYTEAIHDLVGLASVEAATQLARALAGTRAGVGAALAAWTDRSARYQAGQLGVIDLVADLDTLAFPGEPAMEQTFEDVAARLKYADPRIFDAARRLVGRMDSRVAHQAELAGIAFSDLLDLQLAERHYRRVVELAAPSYPAFVIWYARYRGADTSLVRMVGDTALSEDRRAEALRYVLDDQHVDDEAVRAAFRRLIASRPDRWSLRDGYVQYLKRRRAYQEAVPVVQEWLARHGEASGFDFIFARTALAGLYDELGRFAAAWSVIEPVVESYQAGAMGRGALILTHLGRADEAARLARVLVERYPDSPWGHAVLAEVLWSQGAYEQAGVALQKARPIVASSDWRWEIGKGFVRAFGRRPAAEGGKAFAALAKMVPAWELEGIAEAAHDGGENALAFTLQSQLKATASAGSLEIPVRGYAYLKAWRGKTAALTWLKSQIPRERLNQASMTFYRERQFDLLWELIGDPGPGEQGTFVWLMRSTASLELGSARDPHRAELVAYYDRARSDPYFVMGRYLLGLADEQAMLALATTPDRRCEVAYYLGVKAKSEKRYGDAADWFRVARETEQRKEGEYVWATDDLYRWMSLGRSLSLLGRP